MIARLGPTAVFCGVFGMSAPAAAAGTTPVRIVVQTPPGCSSVPTFYDAVRARTARIHFSTGRDGLELRVHVTPHNGRFRGRLRVVDRDGASSTRDVAGASCEEVVRALSLTAALVVDQLTEPAVDDAGTATDANAARSNGASDHEAATPSQGSVATRAAARDDERDADGEGKAESDDTPSEAERAGASSRRLRVHLGAQALVGELVSPRVSVGGAVFVNLTRVVSPPFAPSVGLSLAHVPAEFGQSEGDVSVRWTSLTLSACPVQFQLGPTISLQPCLTGTGGWLTARGEASAEPLSASRSWWSTGGLGRVSAEIGGGTAVRFELGLSVPLVRRRFITTPPDEIVAESPSVSALGALGLAHGF